MKIYPEHAVRKIDKGGRLTIPSGIRNRFDFNIGDKMEYFVISRGLIYERTFRSKDIGLYIWNAFSAP